MFSCSIYKRQAKIEFRKEPARTDFYVIEVEDIKSKIRIYGPELLYLVAWVIQKVNFL
jgi:hypothetical protein